MNIYITILFLFEILETVNALYYPSNPHIPTMEELKKEYELPFDLIDLQYETTDKETIHLYYGLHPQSTKMLLLFQSNAGCFIERLDILKNYYNFFGISVGILSYRGYGASTGKPSEKGFIEDAICGIKELNKIGISSENIIIIGRSIGVGVTLNTAIHIPVKKIILENGFTSLKDFLYRNNRNIINDEYNQLIMRDPWNNDEKIDLLKKDISLLFLLSEDDEIVPTWMTRKMEQHANSIGLKTVLKTFKGAKHMYLPNYRSYYSTIKEFIDNN